MVLIDVLGGFLENGRLVRMTGLLMKHLILLILFLFAAMTVSANDTPCQVDLYQSQSQFNKVIQKPNDKNLIRLVNQTNITLPEVMAKADRFQIVKPVPEETLVSQEDEEEMVEDVEPSSDSSSILGGMFELLIPAKLRNPAR